MLRLVLAGSVASLTILMAVACGGGDSPTSTVTGDSSGGSEVTAVPTSTVARDSSGSSEVTAVPTSTVARDSSGSSEVAEYAVWCVGLGEREGFSQESDPTWGQSAENHAELIDALEDMSAPEELKAFHDAVIAFYKAAHDFVRMQDPSEPVDSGVANSEMTARAKAIFKVAETVDGETKSQLVDAGCGLASFF